MIRIQDIQTLLQIMLKTIITPGDIVVDATAGNGYDTLFLAELVGANGIVHAFDIQERALHNTRKRLVYAQMFDWVNLYLANHADLRQYIKTSIKAAMFNLGYLPGTDHKVVTEPTSTTKAVMGACQLLQGGGIITITAYRGHLGGLEETAQLKESLKILPSEFSVLMGEYINFSPTDPLWIMIQKK